jgi:hypothetical protein
MRADITRSADEETAMLPKNQHTGLPYMYLHLEDHFREEVPNSQKEDLKSKRRFEKGCRSRLDTAVIACQMARAKRDRS